MMKQNENEMNFSVPLEIIKASEIEPKEVKWLWYPYIPFGKVTLLQGDPGDGKSKLMLSIAALLSKGEPLPFTETEENEPMTIIYQTTEDDADDTVVPRFNSAGGDGENLIFIKEDEKTLSFGDNRIREAIKKYNAKLLILDPLSSYIGENCSMNNDNETRAEFNHLIAVAKEMFRASYSILQDELFNYMTEQGFKGFQRGEYGSTAEHLTSLQYQIKQDKERLEKLQQRIQKEQVKYEPARHISKTLNEIDGMGQKTFTGKMAISKEDYSQLTALAKEGITSRAEIKLLEQNANYYRQKYFDSANALERMKTKYNELKEKCRPFLEALEHFPEVAKLFTEKVRQLFSFKEAQERAEKEARDKERQERIKARKNKRGMER